MFHLYRIKISFADLCSWIAAREREKRRYTVSNLHHNGLAPGVHVNGSSLQHRRVVRSVAIWKGHGKEGGGASGQQRHLTQRCRHYFALRRIREQVLTTCRWPLFLLLHHLTFSTLCTYSHLALPLATPLRGLAWLPITLLQHTTRSAEPFIPSNTTIVTFSFHFIVTSHRHSQYYPATPDQYKRQAHKQH